MYAHAGIRVRGGFGATSTEMPLPVGTIVSTANLDMLGTITSSETTPDGTVYRVVFGEGAESIVLFLARGQFKIREIPAVTSTVEPAPEPTPITPVTDPVIETPAPDEQRPIFDPMLVGPNDTVEAACGREYRDLGAIYQACVAEGTAWMQRASSGATPGVEPGLEPSTETPPAADSTGGEQPGIITPIVGGTTDTPPVIRKVEKKSGWTVGIVIGLVAATIVIVALAATRKKG